MANPVRTKGDAGRTAAYLLLELGRELRVARVSRGMRLADVAQTIGTSEARISRLERGLVPTATLDEQVRIAAAVGMRFSARLYPGGRRVLDKPQLELLDRLRDRSHSSWRWRTEVPIPLPGDLRAADATATNATCCVMLELMTRFFDFQGQSRPALLKKRDLGVDRLILVVSATNGNRRAVREAGDAVRLSFPLTTRQILGALAEGRDPGGDGMAII